MRFYEVLRLAQEEGRLAHKIELGCQHSHQEIVAVLREEIGEDAIPAMPSDGIYHPARVWTYDCYTFWFDSVDDATLAKLKFG